LRDGRERREAFGGRCGFVGELGESHGSRVDGDLYPEHRADVGDTGGVTSRRVTIAFHHRWQVGVTHSDALVDPQSSHGISTEYARLTPTNIASQGQGFC
jgi:hypothetical protein